MSKAFRTPATRELPRVLDPTAIHSRFWSRVAAPKRGSAVLKTGSTFKTVDNPTPEEVASADKIYWGGYVHTISDDEAAALSAAGYTITEE